MQNVNISVVIPVYNTLPWMLTQCFDSVLRQTHPVHQMIVVDDGSEETETLACLEKYAAQYPGQVVLKHNPHGGIAKTRNAGLEMVQSDYVCFLDSDDYWHADFLEKLAGCVNTETDIAFCGYELVNTQGDRSDGTFPSADTLRDPKRYPYYTCGCGSRLHRMEHLRKYGCIFPEGSIMEDEAFSDLSILTAGQMASVESYGYSVRQRADSFGQNRKRFNAHTATSIPLATFSRCLSLAPQASSFARDVVFYRIASALMTSSWVFCCYAPKTARREMAEQMAGFFRENKISLSKASQVHHALQDSSFHHAALRVYGWGVRLHMEKISASLAGCMVRAVYRIRDFLKR